MEIKTFNRNDSIRPIRIKGEDPPVAGSVRQRRVTPVEWRKDRCFGSR